MISIPAYSAVRFETGSGSVNVSAQSLVDIARSRANLLASAAMDTGLSDKDIYLIQGAYAEIQALLKVLENHVQIK